MVLRYLALAVVLVLAGNALAIDNPIERFAGPDPGAMDSVIVGVDSTYPPHGGILPVSFVNDEPLLALEVTLQTTNPAVVVDSVSFDGGRLDVADFGGWTRDDSSGAVTIFVFAASEGAIAPGAGLLARLFLSYPETLQGQTVIVDSATVLIDLIEHTTGFTDTTSNGFTPQFQAGELVIEPPCCQDLTGNIIDSDDMVDVGDLTILITYLFIDYDVVLPCPEAANISGDAEGSVDVSDLTTLIGYLFIDAEENIPAACQ